MTTTMKALRLVPPTELHPPPDRGRLLTAAQVAAELLPPGTPPRFVRDHIFPRVVLGKRTVYWYEHDVKTWLEQQRVKEPT